MILKIKLLSQKYKLDVGCISIIYEKLILILSLSFF